MSEDWYWQFDGYNSLSGYGYDWKLFDPWKDHESVANLGAEINEDGKVSFCVLWPGGDDREFATLEMAKRVAERLVRKERRQEKEKARK